MHSRKSLLFSWYGRSSATAIGTLGTVVGTFLGVVALVSACGGNVDDAVSDDDLDRSDASSDGGGSGNCTVTALDASRACVPGIAPTGRAITVQVDDPDGCLGCFTTIEPCSVSVSGTTIELSLTQRACRPTGDVGCPAVCGIPKATCTIPALDAGQYTVTVRGEESRTGLSPRTLVVGDASDAATSCELSAPHETVPPLDTSSLSRTCATDEDCVLVRDGNLCQPCACANTAIAKTEIDEYGKAARALASQCVSPDDGIACAGCAPTKAQCQLAGATGTCAVVPGQ